MLLISIDGACRRNGKPDCVSSGGVFIQRIIDTQRGLVNGYTFQVTETESTNQRGELSALICALECIAMFDDEARVVTDSEYLFNAMTKNWYTTWEHNDWLTSSGEPVKNADLWRRVVELMKPLKEVIFYYIKGHIIPFGKVTATSRLLHDDTGMSLYREARKKFNAVKPVKAEIIEAAQALSVKNNGYVLSDDVLANFVAMNVVADAIATMAVEKADK